MERDYVKWIVLWYLSCGFVSNYPIIFRNNLLFLLSRLLGGTLFLHRCVYAFCYGLGAQNTGGAQEMLACCITTCGIVPPLSRRRLSSLSVFMSIVLPILVCGPQAPPKFCLRYPDLFEMFDRPEPFPHWLGQLFLTFPMLQSFITYGSLCYEDLIHNIIFVVTPWVKFCYC